MESKLCFPERSGVSVQHPTDRTGSSHRFPPCVSQCCQLRWGGLVPSCFPPLLLLLMAALALHMLPMPVPVYNPCLEEDCGLEQGKEALHHPGAPPALCRLGSPGAEPSVPLPWCCRLGSPAASCLPSSAAAFC